MEDRLGLKFNANLTDEQKKLVMDVPDFQQYRDMAEKLYAERQAKKEKATLSKKYKIVDIPASGKRGMDGVHIACASYIPKTTVILFSGDICVK